jgi:transcriptional regulator with PAS, ATPase and Fis domain
VLVPARGAAESDLPIIVQGETGSGKERVVQAIHEWSGRRGPFVGVNCAAVPEAMAEAELFGYRRGAFTGADRGSTGHLRAADRGTLLLDEIGDLPLALQPKLLRALEQRAVVPLGESTPIPIDVRVVAATQEPLAKAVEEKRFRADLYARLDGLTVPLPPLRERSEDVPGLFAHMLARHLSGPLPSVDARLVEQLCLHDWPFNVREVDLLARRLAALHGREPVLRRSHLPDRMLSEWRRRDSDAPSADATVRVELGAEVRIPAARPTDEADLRREQELEALLQTLRLHEGNVTRAARELGISRQKVYRIMEGRPDVGLDDLRGGRGQIGRRGGEEGS